MPAISDANDFSATSALIDELPEDETEATEGPEVLTETLVPFSTDIPQILTQQELTQLYEVVYELRQLMSQSFDVTNRQTNFSKAVTLLRDISDEELKLLVCSDTGSSGKPNAENELLRGILQDMLRARNITPENTIFQPVRLIKDATSLQLPNGSTFQVYTVVSDKSVRARDSKALPPHEEPINCWYSRTFRGSSRELPAQITECFFSDRVGVPSFLSSFGLQFKLVHSALGIKSQKLTVSENSVRMTADNWERLFQQLQRLFQQHYALEELCLREHFVLNFSQNCLSDSQAKRMSEQLDEQYSKGRTDGLEVSRVKKRKLPTA